MQRILEPNVPPLQLQFSGLDDLYQPTKQKNKDTLVLDILKRLAPIDTLEKPYHSIYEESARCNLNHHSTLKYASQQLLASVSSSKLIDNDDNSLNILFEGDYGDIEASSVFTSSDDEDNPSCSINILEDQNTHNFEYEFMYEVNKM